MVPEIKYLILTVYIQFHIFIYFMILRWQYRKIHKKIEHLFKTKYDKSSLVNAGQVTVQLFFYIIGISRFILIDQRDQVTAHLKCRHRCNQTDQGIKKERKRKKKTLCISEEFYIISELKIISYFMNLFQRYKYKYERKYIYDPIFFIFLSFFLLSFFFIE